MTYLLTYAIFMLGLIVFLERKHVGTVDGFLVADRSIGGWSGSLSIAASWIWAPALFVSTQIGYIWGYAALIWFVIPNILALFIFGFIAPRIKHKVPLGYSYIDYLQPFGGGFRAVQLSLQMLMQVVILSLQLTAGAHLLALVTGASYTSTVIMMTVLPLLYSLLSGLRSSIVTDVVQYGLILFATLMLFAGFPYTGLLTLSPEIERFTPFDQDMLLEFGYASAIGLFFAIFADHQQWQRIFAVKNDQETSTFMRGGILHGIITCCLGTLGVLIFLSGFTTDNIQLVGIEFITAKMPPAFKVIFVYMALCGLCSTIDSSLCAFGGLFAKHVAKSTHIVGAARLAMITLATFGIALALFRLPIITLWFLAGTLRLSAFSPTIFSILFNDYRGITGSLSILSSILIGGSIFLIGIAYDDPLWRTAGMVVALLVSLGVSLVATALRTPLER